MSNEPITIGAGHQQPNLHFQAALAEDHAFERVVSTFFSQRVKAGLKARCLAEMHRVLRPGGRAVVSVQYQFPPDCAPLRPAESRR